jgi:hypothetical protein
MKQLFKHDDQLYLVLRVMNEHNFKNKDGSINMNVLKAWRDHLGGDHVLKQHNQYLIVETIKEIEYENCD